MGLFVLRDCFAFLQWWQGDDAHRFSRLVEAHDCLVDQECRAKYDEEMRGVATEQQLGWHVLQQTRACLCSTGLSSSGSIISWYKNACAMGLFLRARVWLQAGSVGAATAGEGGAVEGSLGERQL